MDGIQQFSLDGKVIVITGATGVLGESFALSTAAAGAKVAVLGRNKERADARVAAIKKNGGDAIAVITDVLDEQAVHRAKDEILDAWGTKT